MMGWGVLSNSSRDPLSFRRCYPEYGLSGFGISRTGQFEVFEVEVGGKD